MKIVDQIGSIVLIELWRVLKILSSAHLSRSGLCSRRRRCVLEKPLTALCVGNVFVTTLKSLKFTGNRLTKRQEKDSKAITSSYYFA
jgi:hypothetical protein